jgi:hypothetical protein
MIKFCFSCGSKLDYKYSPPKFCSNCGQEVNASTKKPKEDVQNVTLAEEDAEEIPQIEKLEYEIDIEENGIRKLGQIMGEKTSSTARIVKKRNLEDLK